MRIIKSCILTIIFGIYAIYSQGSFALILENKCEYFERGKNSEVSAIESFFSGKEYSDGINGVKVCFSGEMASIYHLSEIKKASGVYYYYSDLVFKGKSDPLSKIKNLPYKGRINSYPSLYMCTGSESCGSYEAVSYSLVDGLSLFLYKKVHDCLVNYSSSEMNFRKLFVDGSYHPIDGSSKGFRDAFPRLIEIRRYIFNGKDPVSLSFNVGNISGYPAYQMDIYSSKSWRIVFDLSDRCISVKDVFEIEE